MGVGLSARGALCLGVLYAPGPGPCLADSDRSLSRLAVLRLQQLDCTWSYAAELFAAVSLGNARVDCLRPPSPLPAAQLNPFLS